MAEQQVCHIHPLGWENDPDEERYWVSPLDYIGPCAFLTYALYFKLADEEKAKALETLQCGLERTLSQTRHLSSTVEKGPDGDHWFVRKKANTVELRVQWLDAPENAGMYPSLQDMEEAHFTARALSDLNLWQIPEMHYSQANPAAHPDNHPAVLAFRASFVRGGLVLVTHMHHLASDLFGWTGFVQQLADNCRAPLTGEPYPPWDPASLVIARRLAKPPVPDAHKLDASASPLRHPSPPSTLTGGRQNLLFHLPASKAAQLKALAQPPPNSCPPSPWKISTYDATMALLMRTLARVRHPHYADQIPRSTRPLWGETINMRARAHRGVPPGVAPLPNPLPSRMQRNFMALAVNAIPMPGVGAAPTVAGLVPAAVKGKGVGDGDGDDARFGKLAELVGSVSVVAEGGQGKEDSATEKEEEPWSLHQIAVWVRSMTEVAGTRAALEQLHDLFHMIRDRARVAADLHQLPAMAIAVSDHRGAAAVIGGGAEAGAEFGFGKPVAYRQLWGAVDVGMVYVYPARAGGEDEGIEITIAFEKVLAKELVEDEEFGKWFEYRGVDWEEDE